MDYAVQHQTLSDTPMYLTRPLGIIEIKGTSRLDLIDRMSTQKVKDLKSEMGAATIFTTDIGRIIDRVCLYAAEEQVIAVTGANNGENMIRYLMRYVFFNDDFHMRDLSQSYTAVSLYGATAAPLLQQLFQLDLKDLSLHHWRTAALGETPITIHRTDPLGGDGFLILVPRDHHAVLTAALNQSGAGEMTREMFGYLRVVEGLPLLGFEMTGDYIPLETGLWDDVSFNKGCYIGQEIIARMDSRGKISKKLVRLQAGEGVERGAIITAAGRKAGTVTSIIEGQALGYVKSAVLDKSAELMAGDIPLTLRD